MKQRGNKADLPALAAVVSRAIVGWKYGSAQPETADEERLRKHAQALVWQLRRAYEAFAGYGFADQFAQFINRIAPAAGQIEKALIAWVNLIEVLVQEAEREYGSAVGRGPQKAELVKAALLHLILDRPQLTIPDIPEFLVPIVTEIGVDCIIDAVVVILNQNQLWEPVPVQASDGIGIFARALRLLRQFWRWLTALAPVRYIDAWWAKLTRRLILAAYPLSPQLKAAVQKIENTEGASIEDILNQSVATVRWIGEHRNEVLALIQVVAAAIQEAEFIGQLSGPEKKVYARDLILAFLESIGIIDDRTGLTYQIADSFLDWVIDAVVQIFNKRADSFGKRTRSATPSSLRPQPAH